MSDTMMKFASFEAVVETIYKYVIPIPKENCSKNKQLGVSFGAGYIAGVLCAIVSHPADNLVSFLNNAKGATVGDVSATKCMHAHTHYYISKQKQQSPCSVLLSNAYLRSVFTIKFAGSEENWCNGSFHSWPSTSYSYDWNTNWSTMGAL